MRDSFAGRAVRVKDNGLGFDQTRLGSLADDTSIWIDPVVEELAFFGLAILPVRGKGIDRRMSRSFAAPRDAERMVEAPPRAPFRVACMEPAS